MSHIISHVKAYPNHRLLVTFACGTQKLYDMMPLIAQNSLFAPLAEIELFYSGQIDPNGRRLVWCEDVALSSDEIWERGMMYGRVKKPQSREIKHYDHELKGYAQELRHNMTKSEVVLWTYFLKKHYPKIHRQKPIDHYILDFYCNAAQLGIELDGAHHYQDSYPDYDAHRTKRLNAMGIEIIRFTNREVADNLRGVCEAIEKKIKERIAALDEEGG